MRRFDWADYLVLVIFGMEGIVATTMIPFPMNLPLILQGFGVVAIQWWFMFGPGSK